MNKKIDLVVAKCSECPYFRYNASVDENECGLLDELLFFDMHHNRPGKDGRYSDEIIYSGCPLPDTNETRTK